MDHLESLEQTKARRPLGAVMDDARRDSSFESQDGYAYSSRDYTRDVRKDQAMCIDRLEAGGRTSINRNKRPSRDARDFAAKTA